MQIFSLAKYPLPLIALVMLLIAPVLPAQEDGDDFTREDYQNAIDSGLYEEAGIAAKSRLEKAIREGRSRELSTVSLLHDLAEVQRLGGEYDSAIQNYELAIEIVEERRDMLDLGLTEPLIGLGQTYLESGRADLSLDYLERALHVRSVNEGPHSIEQAVTLELLADAHRSIGNHDDAADAAERMYLMYVRKYTQDSLEVVPVLLKQGHILGDIREWRRQRNAYNEALSIAEANGGKLSIHAIRPLVSLGNSYATEYFDRYLSADDEDELPSKDLLTEAENHFGMASELVLSDAGVDWRIRKDALLAIGDFYTMTNEQSRARLVYRTAWDLLSGTDEKLRIRQRELEQTRPLIQPEPKMSIALPAELDLEDPDLELGTGFIVSQFTVTRRGRLSDIGLLEIVPERNEQIEAEVKRVLTMFIYRPRFDLARAIDTVGNTVRFEFPYVKSLPERP
jgi:tetratricopeptide (TPR) repeat protein